MELYLLNDQLRREHIVDEYESLIWTERWQDVGEIVLDIKSTPLTRSLFYTGRLMKLSESDRLMEVATIIDEGNSDNERYLRITGPSIERVLADRTVAPSMSFTYPYEYEDTPWYMATMMFLDVCFYGILSSDDILPFFDLTPMPRGGVQVPGKSEIIRWTLEKPTTLYEAINDICRTYDYGYCIRYNSDSQSLHWEVYTGIDRTRDQTETEPVVFSPELGTLGNLAKIQTIAGSKNVANVFYETTSVTKKANIWSSMPSGFDRRVLTVAVDTQPSGNITSELNKIANAQLDNYRASEMLDGQIMRDFPGYGYGEDYLLGDLVEIKDENEVFSLKRVTEQTFVSDANGERSYPTLMYQESPDSIWLGGP